jgi:hypothetical protein
MTETQYQDVIELAKGPGLTLVVDQRADLLKAGLEAEGYKVVTSDEDVRELARGGWTIVTRNPEDFVGDAIRFDYDIIAIETDDIAKIAAAIRRSSLATRKGNFLLRVLGDGSFHLRQLV